MKIARAKIIINPAAGHNATRKKWNRLSRILKHIGLAYDHNYTEGSGHAIELAREAATSGYEYLVAVGGDGTVNEVANGIILTGHGPEISLGVVSTGTGSDFARSIGIPMHYEAAGGILKSENRLTIDAGAVCFTKNDLLQERFFVNAGGIGFDAAAVDATERMPKYFGGTLPYLAGLLRTLITYRNKSVTLKIDGKEESEKVLSIMVANGNYLGGGMHIAPNARVNDQIFDIVTIGDVSKLDLLKSLPMIYKGTHEQHPKVSIRRGTSVEITSTDRILIHADGEILGEGSASFRMLPAALNIVI